MTRTNAERHEVAAELLAGLIGRWPRMDRDGRAELAARAPSLLEAANAADLRLAQAVHGRVQRRSRWLAVEDAKRSVERAYHNADWYLAGGVF
jgi:hypothetical protein